MFGNPQEEDETLVGLEAFEAAIQRDEAALAKTKRSIASYKVLDLTLSNLAADATTHTAMVPVCNGLGYFYGQLTNLNELLVLLGENYFAVRSVQQTRAIISRRLAFLQAESTVLGLEVEKAKLRLQMALDEAPMQVKQQKLEELQLKQKAEQEKEKRLQRERQKKIDEEDEREAAERRKEAAGNKAFEEVMAQLREEIGDDDENIQEPDDDSEDDDEELKMLKAKLAKHREERKKRKMEKNEQKRQQRLAEAQRKGGGDKKMIIEDCSSASSSSYDYDAAADEAESDRLLREHVDREGLVEEDLLNLEEISALEEEIMQNGWDEAMAEKVIRQRELEKRDRRLARERSNGGGGGGAATNTNNNKRIDPLSPEALLAATATQQKKQQRSERTDNAGLATTPSPVYSSPGDIGKNYVSPTTAPSSSSSAQDAKSQQKDQRQGGPIHPAPREVSSPNVAIAETGPAAARLGTTVNPKQQQPHAEELFLPHIPVQKSTAVSETVVERKSTTTAAASGANSSSAHSTPPTRPTVTTSPPAPISDDVMPVRIPRVTGFGGNVPLAQPRQRKSKFRRKMDGEIE